MFNECDILISGHKIIPTVWHAIKIIQSLHSFLFSLFSLHFLPHMLFVLSFFFSGDLKVVQSTNVPAFSTNQYPHHKPIDKLSVNSFINNPVIYDRNYPSYKTTLAFITYNKDITYSRGELVYVLVWDLYKKMSEWIFITDFSE